MYLGVDLGGSKLLAVALAPDGEPVGRWRFPTGDSFSPAQCLRAIEEVLVDIRSVRAIGVGFPGLVDARSGVVRSSVILDGWEGYRLREELEDRFGVPCKVENDVNNAARAERVARDRLGAGDEDFLFVAIGTGIGGALVLGGEVWLGASGLAGEVGHVSTGLDVPCRCGRAGCVGAVAGGRALFRKAREPAVDRTTGARGVSATDPREALDSAYWVGSAVADSMNLLNLPLVVLGGGVSELGEPYRRAVDFSFRGNAMREVAEDCRIELALSGYDAGAFGSVVLALEAAQAPLPRRLIEIPDRGSEGQSDEAIRDDDHDHRRRGLRRPSAPGARTYSRYAESAGQAERT